MEEVDLNVLTGRWCLFTASCSNFPPSLAAPRSGQGRKLFLPVKVGLGVDVLCCVFPDKTCLSTQLEVTVLTMKIFQSTSYSTMLF